jgi:hypothetical protein
VPQSQAASSRPGLEVCRCSRGQARRPGVPLAGGLGEQRWLEGDRDGCLQVMLAVTGVGQIWLGGGGGSARCGRCLCIQSAPASSPLHAVGGYSRETNIHSNPRPLAWLAVWTVQQESAVKHRRSRYRHQMCRRNGERAFPIWTMASLLLLIKEIRLRSTTGDCAYVRYCTVDGATRYRWSERRSRGQFGYTMQRE